MLQSALSVTTTVITASPYNSPRNGLTDFRQRKSALYNSFSAITATAMIQVYGTYIAALSITAARFILVQNSVRIGDLSCPEIPRNLLEISRPFNKSDKIK